MTSKRKSERQVNRKWEKPTSMSVTEGISVQYWNLFLLGLHKWYIAYLLELPNETKKFEAFITVFCPIG